MQIFLKYIPAFIRNEMPEDLISALSYVSKPSPDVKGRTSAIKNDDVKSLAYFCKTKSKIYEKLSFFKDGRGMYPYHFAIQLNKLKCIAYCVCAGTYVRERDLQIMLKSDVPRWFKFILYLKLDELYDEYDIRLRWEPEKLISNAINREMPIEWIKYYLNQYDEWRGKRHDISPLSERKANSDVDVPFFSNLSHQEQLYLVELIKNRKLNFDIRSAIEASDSFDLKAEYFSVNYIIRESKKLNQFDKFAAYVDSHRKRFDDLRLFSIISSGNSEYYQYAFKHVEKVENKDRLYGHFESLIKKKSFQEIQFIISKGYEPDHSHKILSMRTLDKETIDAVHSGSSTSETFFELYTIGFKRLDKLLELGYRISR